MKVAADLKGGEEWSRWYYVEGGVAGAEGSEAGESEAEGLRGERFNQKGEEYKRQEEEYKWKEEAKKGRAWSEYAYYSGRMGENETDFWKRVEEGEVSNSAVIDLRFDEGILKIRFWQAEKLPTDWHGGVLVGRDGQVGLKFNGNSNGKVLHTALLKNAGEGGYRTLIGLDYKKRPIVCKWRHDEMSSGARKTCEGRPLAFEGRNGQTREHLSEISEFAYERRERERGELEEVVLLLARLDGDKSLAMIWDRDDFQQDWCEIKEGCEGLTVGFSRCSMVLQLSGNRKIEGRESIKRRGKAKWDIVSCKWKKDWVLKEDVWSVRESRTPEFFNLVDYPRTVEKDQVVGEIGGEQGVGVLPLERRIV